MQRGITLLVTLLLTSLMARADDRLPLETRPLMTDWLDQGKAEFTIYDATIVRYGQARQGAVTHIWVKEPWDDRRGIKHGGQGQGDYEVIKLNQIISFPTGMYRYEQMWSGFWKRENAERVKFSLSHHEACGNTFKQLRFTGPVARFTWFSYFEEHGDGERKLHLPPETVFYDELPFKLRLLAFRGLSKPITVLLIPTIIHAQSDTMKTSPATILQTRRDQGEIEFEIRHADGADRLTYETKTPFKLLRSERADGSSLRLRKSLFTDYWNHNQPGDEKMLE